VSSSAAHNSVLPLRGVAQIKYERAGSRAPDLPPIMLSSLVTRDLH
jgi:hypothetical protein